MSKRTEFQKMPYAAFILGYKLGNKIVLPEDSKYARPEDKERLVTVGRVELPSDRRREFMIRTGMDGADNMAGSRHGLIQEGQRFMVVGNSQGSSWYEMWVKVMNSKTYAGQYDPLLFFKTLQELFPTKVLETDLRRRINPDIAVTKSSGEQDGTFPSIFGLVSWHGIDLSEQVLEDTIDEFEICGILQRVTSCGNRKAAAKHLNTELEDGYRKWAKKSDPVYNEIRRRYNILLQAASEINRVFSVMDSGILSTEQVSLRLKRSQYRAEIEEAFEYIADKR